MSGIAKVDAVVIFVISKAAVLLPVGGPQRVLEKVRSKVVNCKPDRLVMVEYTPMHLKGFHARVPALVVAVVFTSQAVSLIEFHVPSPSSRTPESNRLIRSKLQVLRNPGPCCITFHFKMFQMAREYTPASEI
jgi:hypothetical protein